MSKKKKKKTNLIKKIKREGNIKKLIISVVTIVCISIFVTLAVLTLLNILDLGLTAFDFLIFSFLSGTGIYGMYKYLEIRRIYKIDEIFPDFVRDLAESRRAGMTFTKAILFAAKGDYGILTPEIKKISQQVSWGASVTNALKAFAERVPTKSIRRTVSLITDASKSGGNIAEILDVAAQDAREIKMLEGERTSNMGSYVVVIYVGMFVFIAIVLIMNVSFLPSMIGEDAEGLAGAVTGGSTIDLDKIISIFYFATLVQGIGSGMVAGVFENGRFSSGIKHMFIMTFVTWFVFKMFVGI